MDTHGHPCQVPLDSTMWGWAGARNCDFCKCGERWFTVIGSFRQCCSGVFSASGQGSTSSHKTYLQLHPDRPRPCPAGRKESDCLVQPDSLLSLGNQLFTELSDGS